MTKLKKLGEGDIEEEEDSGWVGVVKFIPLPAKVDRMEGRGSTLEGMEEAEGGGGELNELGEVKELGEGNELGEGPIPAPPVSGGRDLDIQDLLLSGMTVLFVCLSLMCVFKAPSEP